MRTKEKDILILCDREEEYARLMTDFMKLHKELPWEIHTYTAANILLQEECKREISMLVVAESTYSEEMKALRPLCTVILNESGLMKWESMENVNKYQQADHVLRSLLEIYAGIAGRQLPGLAGDFDTKFIGIYSPVRRSMQTSFALTMSQMLSVENRTLYLNFEHYAGVVELLPDMQTKDMADLLYFLDTDKDRFRLRMQAMIQQKGSLDYIPPMKAGQNLLTVTMGEWIRLLKKIAELGEYEYVILDLSESMQGLFDILRICTKVFTLTQEDCIAQSKLVQYEQMLALYEYEDVLKKTCKCKMPQIRKLPKDLEQYTKGDMADYVRRQLKELHA
uniref:hypothetical protein n=1 Tax=Acetatifactor sp. TaxID=1872090 RepID=UPI004056D093